MTRPERTAHRRVSVLVLIKSLDLGGAEKLLVDGARFWDRNAYDYTVAYVLAGRDSLVPQLRGLGIEPISIGRDRLIGTPTPVRLRRMIGERDIDLVHVHSPATAVMARLVSPVPVVYTEHNVPQAYRRLTRLGNRLTYRRNAAVIAVSTTVSELVSGHGGPEPQVIPAGVDPIVEPREAAAARAELGLRPDDPLVVHVGQIRRGKGHEALIDMAAHLAESHPHVSIVSIGEGKEQSALETLRREARVRGLARLRFIGPRTDAMHFVAAADAVVSPATAEGGPLTVLEAMALGRPVVATAVGLVPEAIVDGISGLIVPPGRPDLLARAVARLLDDPALRESVAQAGREVASTRYGLESMVRAIEGVYREVLDG